jgi:lipopolysaccharide export system protein LptA
MMKYFCLAILFFVSINSFAQEKNRIELIHADVDEYDQELHPDADRLIGNVMFKHNNAVMTCDSAYLNKKANKLEAFGNVRINQGDTVTMTGRHLFYDGNTRQAQMFDNVEMRDRKMVLNTSRMDYNMDLDIASYNDSAHIVGEENILTSKRGSYYSKSHDMYYKQDVLLVNPKFTMTCDTLKYNTLSKISYFLGPTYIRSKENLIYCEGGWYDTEKQLSLFTNNAYMKTKEQILRGDTVEYDRMKSIGRAFGNVSVNDSANKIIISGDFAEYFDVRDSSYVTGRAMMTQILDNDSLFMHGDTLMAVADADTSVVDSSGNRKKNLYAFHHVKMFKNDLQGRCDSLVYSFKDSSTHMFYEPVLWSGLNQLTADSITIQSSNSKIDKMYLVNSAFIASRGDSLQKGELDSLKFNQVRGKNMMGFFSDNHLYKINVTGNGQTIYYAKNKNQKDFGVNRADCSDMVILIDSNKVKQITLLTQPDGTLYPIKELSAKELRLKGFSWHGDARPMKKEDIFE